MLFKPKTIAIIAVIVVSIAVPIALAIFNNRQQTGSQQTSNATIDASWVAKAKALAEKYEPYPENTSHADPGVFLAYYNMHLVENGTDQLIFFGDGDTLGGFLGELLRNGTLLNETVSKELLDDVLANNQVLILTYRASVLGMMNPSAKYCAGYFILEDNLDKGLTGTIVARELRSNDLRLLAISKVETQNGQIDTSWTAEMERLLEEAKPYPDIDKGQYNLAFQNIFLRENGTSQIIVHESSFNNTIYSYLENLVVEASQQGNVIDQEHIDNILTLDTVVELRYRFPADLGSYADVRSAYFILEDNLGEELQGTIIVDQAVLVKPPGTYRGSIASILSIRK